MNACRMQPLKYPWPPLLYGGAAILALAVDDIFGLAPSLDGRSMLIVTLGAIMGTAALAINLWAVHALMDNDTSLSLLRPARRLVTEGPYRYTRNPIYLGYTLLMMAAGLVLDNAWLLVAAPVSAVMTTCLAIRREEMHLLIRFGEDFERYCKSVPRWL